MRYVVSSQEMKAADSFTIETIGLSAKILIEHAASSVYEKLASDHDLSGMSAVIFCGTGNNGADGLALGRMLTDGGCKVTCVMTGNRDRATDENVFELEAARKKNIKILSLTEYEDDAEESAEYDFVIDALFGVGLSREVTGDYKTAIGLANSCRGEKIALDVPSGISSDDGKVLGLAFDADITYTFAFVKRGLLFYPGRSHAGRVELCGCGIGADALSEKHRCVQLEGKDIGKILPARPATSHKGSCGRVLAIAGGPDMPGAAAFCAEAAYRAGAGLVKILTPRENLVPLQARLPEAIYQAYEKEPDSDAVSAAVSWADVVLIGPGIGKNAAAKRILEIVLTETKVPLVIDADAINLLAEDMSLLEKIKAPAVLTPHLGEMGRLIGEKVSDIEDNMIKYAAEFADKYRVNLVLKSAVSVIAEPDGRIYVNTTGNDALSKGGSGDVLSGFIAGLLAGGGDDISVSGTSAAAAFLCGKNADLLTERMSGRSVIASDILKNIGEVLSTYG